MIQATENQPQEPNAELIRSLLRFRDDKRDWTSPLSIERTDAPDATGYPSHLGGETITVVIDGTDHEFCRWTGRGLFGPTPTMRIAIQDLYCVHPVTYRVREPQRARFRGESPWDALVSSQGWDLTEEEAFLQRFPDAKTQDEERLTAYLVRYRESGARL